jgi:peptidoglycan DL-endopeptidase CwlO
MPRFPTLPRNVVATAILCGALAVTASSSRPAFASPIDDARAKANAIAEQRLAIVEAAERLNQRRQATSDELKRLSLDEAVAMNDVAGRNKTLEASRANAAAVAVQAYLHGSQSPTLEGLVVVGHADTAPLREAYATTLYGDAGDAIDAARAARDDLQVAARALRDLIASRAELQASLDRDQAALEAKERDLADLAARTDRTIETLVAEEQDRLAREAEAKAKAEADRQAAETPRFTEPPVTAHAASAPPQGSSRPSATQGARPASNAPKPVAPKPASNAPKSAAPATTVVRAPAPTKAPAKTPTKTPTTARPTETTAEPADPVTAEPADPSPEPDPTQATPAPRATTTVAKTTTTKAPAPKPIPPPPAPSSGAGAAVAEAKRQLGKPYKFGAVGPDSFDCSGLTQWAWVKGGVSMDHYTGSQYHSFPQVPLDQLQPGDLVFFRADLGHMGMYIGGGQFIHAPQTGDVVKISPLAGRSIVGAVRPG